MVAIDFPPKPQGIRNPEPAHADWEVLSSVGSVISIGTEGATYADIVKLSVAGQTVQPNILVFGAPNYSNEASSGQTG